MRRLVAVVILSLLCRSLPAQAQLNPLWTRFVDGPPSGDSDQASALAVDSSGCVYVTGTAAGAGTSYDYETVKYAPDGTLLWNSRYDSGSLTYDFSYAIAVDRGGNVYVTGGSILNYPHYDWLTIKYDPDGDTLWTRRYDGATHENDFALALAVDSLGNAYVTGQTGYTGPESDITTIKYTPAGDAAWVRTVTGPGESYDRANVVMLDHHGNPLVAGWYSSGGNTDFITIKYDPAGNVLWSEQYDAGFDQAFGMSIDAMDNVFVVGRSFVGSGVGGFDYASVKYSASGTLEWARRFNGAGNSRDDGFACAVDADGNLYVTGFSVGLGSAEDIVTVKYAPNGDSLWVRGYNGPANLDDYAYAVAVSSAGLVYVCGLSNGGATSYDIVTLVYLPDGKLLATDRIDGSAHGYDNPGNGSYPTPYLAVDSGGNAYVTGWAINASPDFVTVKYGPISPPSVHVLFPDGGGNYLVGSDLMLAWTATDSSGPLATVDLFISRDNGTTYVPIALSVPNTGTYPWTVTPPGTNGTSGTAVYSAFFKVVATNDGGYPGSDASNAPFSIFDGATAVVLTGLEADPTESGVTIRWHLSLPEVVSSINLERSSTEIGPWIAVSATQRDDAGFTVAVDNTAAAGQTYWYRLVASTSYGTQAVFGPVKSTAAAPREFALSAIWPNPSTSSMKMEFSVARAVPLHLSILDLQGREVKVLADGVLAPGRYHVAWDGMTNRGRVPAGVYFVRYLTPDRKFVQRLVIAQ